MRRTIAIATLSLAAGCGVESALWNIGHQPFERPASKITGAAPADVELKDITVMDGAGLSLEPFQSSLADKRYELRLPSAKYSMLRVRTVKANMELRAIVPAIGEESEVKDIDLDARNIVETLIVEARLSMKSVSLKQVTPATYEGTRKLIRDALDGKGSAEKQAAVKDLLGMVERVMTAYDKDSSASEPYFFGIPVIDKDCKVAVASGKLLSPLDNGWLGRNGFDYVGDGRKRLSSDDFDAKLCETAKLFEPDGCKDDERIRVVFTVDFNKGAKQGACAESDRFKWATDKPGKKMFFVGWIYTDTAPGPSDILDPAVNTLLGASTPNQLVMYDDGTNGDQKAGDNVWSIFFDLPRGNPPSKVLRIGYKYTWGTTGAVWTGTEEWPGNCRILEVVDDNGDDFVYRRDVFGDEATNKNNSNASPDPACGSLKWTSDCHKCGTPESHENLYDNATCQCLPKLPTPDWLGPLKKVCTE